MDLDEDKLSMVVDLVKHCLLPELDRDIGQEPLQREDFGIFVYGLEKNLMLLFDVVSKNHQILMQSSDATLEFRANFILLLAEQKSVDNGVFQTIDPSLQKHIAAMIRKHFNNQFIDHTVYTRCLDSFKSRLVAQKWKRHIAAVIGYSNFSEIWYRDLGMQTSKDDILFMLSVSINLVDYFEMEFKQIGLKLMNILVNNGDPKLLKELNIFATVYAKLMDPLITIVKDEVSLNYLLDSLYECLKADAKWKQPSDWSNIDDVFEKIFSRLPLESDIGCCTSLFTFVARATVIEVDENEVIAGVFKSLPAELERADLVRLRDICKLHENLLSYRWTKQIFDAMEQQNLLLWTPETKALLDAMHVCYIVGIYGVPLELFNQQLITFVDAFVSGLLALYKSTSRNDQLKQVIDEFLETFSCQIESDQTDKCANIRTSLDELKLKLSE